MLWISSLQSRPTFFCFLYSPVGHVFLPRTAPEALLLVLPTYRTYWVFFASAKESGRAASYNGGDTAALADDSAAQESELAVDGAGLAALPSCAHI